MEEPATDARPESLRELTKVVPSATLFGQWNTRNRETLLRLLERPSSGHYAVFDWDNTCVFLDVEEATLVHQLEHLAFAAEPDQMGEALRRGLPLEDPTVRAHLDDLDRDYRWLWPRYNGLLGFGAREEIEGAPAHLDFRAKFLNLYTHLEHRHGAEVAYPWMPFRFSGMTAQQVRAVSAEAVRWQATQPIETVVWESPKQGRPGAVAVSWRKGLRLLPEMRSLHQALETAGIDVWICTASFVEGIREIACSAEFGYGIHPERVIGLELERDRNGCYRPERAAGSEITYGAGKTEAVRRLLCTRYGREPILVAGDSNGDASMLSDFEQTRISLVIDTGHQGDTPITALATRARQGDPRYLLQGRDEARGCWRS